MLRRRSEAGTSRIELHCDCTKEHSITSRVHSTRDAVVLVCDHSSKWSARFITVSERRPPRRGIESVSSFCFRLRSVTSCSFRRVLVAELVDKEEGKRNTWNKTLETYPSSSGNIPIT